VNALDAALRTALRPHHPWVDEVELADYKVRILDGQQGTDAVTRVLIESVDGAPLDDRRGGRQRRRGLLAGPGGCHGVWGAAHPCVKRYDPRA